MLERERLVGWQRARIVPYFFKFFADHARILRPLPSAGSMNTRFSGASSPRFCSYSIAYRWQSPVNGSERLFKAIMDRLIIERYQMRAFLIESGLFDLLQW